MDMTLIWAAGYVCLGLLALLGAGCALVRSILRADRNETMAALVLVLVAALSGLSSLVMIQKADEAAMRQEK